MHKNRSLFLSVFVLLTIGVVSTAGTLAYLNAKLEQEENVKQYIALWENDIARAILVDKDEKIPIKIMRHLKDFGVSASLECQNPIEAPVTLDGIPARTIELCPIQSELIFRSATSPVFIFGSLFSLVIALLYSFTTLNSYRRSLEQLIQKARLWARNPEQFDEAPGATGIEQEILNTIFAGARAQVEAESTKRELLSNREIQDLTKSLIHDIRSPLGALQLVAKKSSELDDKSQSLLKNSIHRVEEICSSLVTKRRHTEPFDLLKTVELLREEKSLLFPDKRFVVENTTRDSTVRFPSSLISRVLSNLINNSIDAEATLITIKISTQESATTIEVSDDGTGLSKEIQSNLFIYESSSKEFGLGTGLKSAKDALNQFGSDILLKETSPNGTTFTITIPK